jgi:Flp pilus assembly protein TadG
MHIVISDNKPKSKTPDGSRRSAFSKSIKMSSTRKQTIANRTGAATVELALTVGLAFFFFFAALEFTRVSMIRHTVEHALYEGGRQGIIPGATSNEVQSTSTRILRTIGITGATITVTPAIITNSTREVSVRIQLPLDRGLFAPAFFFVGKSLDRTIAMQREGVQ